MGGGDESPEDQFLPVVPHSHTEGRGHEATYTSPTRPQPRGKGVNDKCLSMLVRSSERQYYLSP